MTRKWSWSLAVSLLVLVACSSGGSNGSGGQSCADVCPGIVAAHCQNGPTNESDCETYCNVERNKCPAQFNTVLSCGGSPLQWTCDSSGQVSLAGCQQQLQALESCASASGGSGGGGGSGGSGGVSCASMCPKVVAAGCSNGPSTEADCETGCSSAAGSCPSQYSAVVGCVSAQGGTAQITCNANNAPVVTGCESQYAQLYSCLGI